MVEVNKMTDGRQACFTKASRKVVEWLGIELARRLEVCDMPEHVPTRVAGPFDSLCIYLLHCLLVAAIFK